jgi:trk system potassium uptake protein TrkH
MRWRFILKIIGILVFFFGMTMIFPLIVGLYYHESNVDALMKSMGLTVFSGLLIYLIFRKEHAETISQREGMAIVAVGWTTVGLFGAIPFFLGDGNFSFTDAFFESMSGFTTTGASVVTNIEGLSKGMLFWRSFIQWLGGMGIIVLSVAILPFWGSAACSFTRLKCRHPFPIN